MNNQFFARLYAHIAENLKDNINPVLVKIIKLALLYGFVNSSKTSFLALVPLSSLCTIVETWINKYNITTTMSNKFLNMLFSFLVLSNE